MRPTISRALSDSCRYCGHSSHRPSHPDSRRPPPKSNHRRDLRRNNLTSLLERDRPSRCLQRRYRWLIRYGISSRFATKKAPCAQHAVSLYLRIRFSLGGNTSAGSEFAIGHVPRSPLGCFSGIVVMQSGPRSGSLPVTSPESSPPDWLKAVGLAPNCDAAEAGFRITAIVEGPLPESTATPRTRWADGYTSRPMALQNGFRVEPYFVVRVG
jgi:hypothetical protein